ncbi:protein Tob1-like isoform X1 [Daktulosphaira vitifoliae]|uniref:protein Tob1-like isoform X1 n=1 Tax=Daktulosphaira vitifoliae TaxID=58002 RepID=UPI0021AA8661|nr:protein Tob1-like isoform X1 [Daktulosphaira vitifoliae]
MHIEVSVALNFVISYLYNKLPRRRVNIFGEELEKCLTEKFAGHWYPEKPYRGSAYRCIKTGSPIDPVFEKASRESGVAIQDVLENLPQDLAVWVDPGEVSYRIGEKGAVKILYNESSGGLQFDAHDDRNADREVVKTFNPEAQCFRPIDSVASSLSSLSISPPDKCLSGSPPLASSGSDNSSPTHHHYQQPLQQQHNPLFGKSCQQPQQPRSPSGPSSYGRQPSAPLTFTTASFAQTKFGSTKLKSNNKRANRMSPTEFANYIKQRAAMQQQQIGGAGGQRSVSPPQQQHHRGGQISETASNYFFQQQQQQHQYNSYRPRQSNAFRNSGGLTDYSLPQLQLPNNNSSGGWSSYSEFGPQNFGSPMGPLSPSNYGGVQQSSPHQQPMSQQKMDSFNNMSLGSSSYRSSPYQHLLVAN